MSFFFFSSRRRHTRWPRDWSSDVCSSDLFDQANAAWSCKVVEPGEDCLSASCCDFDDSQQSCQSYVLAHMSGPVDQTRSEERRVGKECRVRRASDHLQ